jgi:hypothetical protein
MLRRITIGIASLALLALPATADAKQHHGKSHKRSHAARVDRNHDGLPDRWERANKLSLAVNQASRDQDRDGAKNAAEFAAGTDPRDRDSDDDGMKDGAEDAGTVTSFDGSKLLITLANGDTVSGLVTSDTEIKGCAATAPATDPTTTLRHDDGEDAGDDHPTSTTTAPATTAPTTTVPAPSTGDDDQGDDDRGDHEGDDDHGDDDASCTTAALTPGAKVHEAQLVTRANGLTFREIELAPQAPAPAA